MMLFCCYHCRAIVTPLFLSMLHLFHARVPTWEGILLQNYNANNFLFLLLLCFVLFENEKKDNCTTRQQQKKTINIRNIRDISISLEKGTFLVFVGI